MTDDPLCFVRHLTPVLRRCVEEGDCLIWTGACSRKGSVPIMRLPVQLPANPDASRPAPVAVARVMYEEAFGEALRPGWSVWRTCLQPRCVNPLHLRAGSKRMMVQWQARQNPRQLSADSRIRVTSARRRHSNIKLGLEAAREIRALQGEKAADEVATTFKVNPSLIYRIWSGAAWREVNATASVFTWMPPVSPGGVGASR